MAKKLSEIDKKASLNVLGDLKKLAQDEMKGKMASLKKVTVASDSKEGLKKGLEKAEEIISDKEIESEEPEMEESEVEESEEMSEEEIDARIKELMALKAKMK